MHIRDTAIRSWLIERMEPIRNRPPGWTPRKKRPDHLQAECPPSSSPVERFLQEHYVGQKRFSLEGGETLIPLLDALIERAGSSGVREIIMGMPHRGRLNVLANVLDKPYGMIFDEFEGDHLPETVGGDGDVKYHLGFSADYVTSEKQTVHLSLTGNPSHLRGGQPGRRGLACAPSSAFDSRTATKPDRHPGLDPRRRGVRRARPGGRDPEPLAASRISDRRHPPHRRQQPDRLHNGPQRGAIDAVLHRRRQDDRGADFPRQRRRPRSRRLRRRAGARLPSNVRQGRRDRHVLLPAARAQRGRRAGVYPADHVREDQESDQHPRALYRAARIGRRALESGIRNGFRHISREDAAGARRSSARLRRAAAEPRVRRGRGREKLHFHSTRSRRVPRPGVSHDVLRTITEKYLADASKFPRASRSTPSS